MLGIYQTKILVALRLYVEACRGAAGCRRRRRRSGRAPLWGLEAVVKRAYEEHEEHEVFEDLKFKG